MNSDKESREKEFSAQKFVKELLTEGALIPCDQSNESFNPNCGLPSFYDEKLYKRGQAFFYNYFFAMLSNVFLGLLVVISVPSIRKMLMFTGMSDSNMKAYRRYLATLLHMKIWYDEDLKPGSRLWKSIKQVRKMHNYASISGSKANIGRISQKDMALTQMGFIGFAVSRGEFISLPNTNEEDMKGFIHIWRVVGHLLGMEERFNICRDSVEETRQICDLLLEQVFYPEIKKKDKDFLELAYYFVKGMWMVIPLCQFKSTMCYLYNIVQNNPDLSEPVYFELNDFQRWHYGFAIWLKNSLKVYWWRVIYNRLLRAALYFVECFPVLAYYYYGIKNAAVDLKI